MSDSRGDETRTGTDSLSTDVEPTNDRITCEPSQRVSMEWLFEFEEEELPTVVLLAAAALIAIFAVGIPIRVLLGLF
ncbi:hypothetical protein B1756_03055 [Natrarchaeobaculum aegyptiacum]|uniref:Uncharacterized protein n=1 Tax=Natrarchaeobaculum aegyptiacum TaxID=745377 RepID=A0A2Z2HQB8_9EURY|nr:hypothetical protein B1756_03055 [Natrarchaeobaculum aegyptiacum]